MTQLTGSCVSQETWRHDWMGLSLLCSAISLGEIHQPGFQGADSLIWCDGLPCAWTCHPLGCCVNTVLCVDGDGRRADHLSSRSRKWELEGSCYQAPSFLPVLHQAKLKPCVFSPRGPPHTAQPGCPAGKWCGLSNNMWSQEAFSPSPFHYCYLNPVSV